MKVLITGAAGTIGRRLADYLRDRHDLILADLHPPAAPQSNDDWRRVDITRLGDLTEACRGVDAIVHLAIASGHEGDYEDEAFNDLRFDVNVKGTAHVFQAAARAGVRRVVHTSSIMVVWGYGPGEYVGPEAEPRPVGTYAVTKHLAEVIARDYTLHHGLTTVCLRIARPVDPHDPRLRTHPIRPQWIAFPDLCRAYELALLAPLEGYHALLLVGETRARRWDLSAARRLLGYEPHYRLDELGCTLDENAPLLGNEPATETRA